MKQTAIQWLIEQYNFGIVLLLQDEITVAEFSQEISRKQKIALEMEKEQVMNSWLVDGYTDLTDENWKKEFEEYYNENYETKTN